MRSSPGRPRSPKPPRPAPRPTSDDAAHVARVFSAIHAVVRRIPRGKVATYGQVAELAGFPRGARVAGYAMRASSSHALPWQRVVGKRGPKTAQVAIRDPIGGTVQRRLLEEEGVRFSSRGGIDLERYGWRPGGRARRG